MESMHAGSLCNASDILHGHFDRARRLKSKQAATLQFLALDQPVSVILRPSRSA